MDCLLVMLIGGIFVFMEFFKRPLLGWYLSKFLLETFVV
jgi:hypothetical protein